MTDTAPPRKDPLRYVRGRKRLPDHAIVALYLAGMSSNEAGFRGGVSNSTVLELVRAAGHPVRPRGSAPGMRHREGRIRMSAAEMVTRYQAGATGAKIAAEAGCCLDTVYRALRKAGVPRRDWRDYRWPRSKPPPT